MLDAEEYLHLAVNASVKGEHHAAMAHLHQCLDLEPENAKAIYLLAAEHGEIGLYDRAIEGMLRALKFDDKLELAKFQLGLLYARDGKNDLASSMWTDLVSQTHDLVLKLFSESLLALLSDDLQSAQEKFESGLNANTSNPGLNESMKKIIDAALAGDIVEEPPASDVDSSPSDSFFLGAYKDNSLEKS